MSRGDDYSAQLREAIGKRCAELGLPSWRCNTAGDILTVPAAFLPGQRWLTAPALQRMVRQAGQRACERGDATAFPIFPGCWIIPLCEMDGIQRSSVILAMAVT